MSALRAGQARSWGHFAQTLRTCFVLLLVGCGWAVTACSSDEPSDPVYENWTARNAAAFSDTMRVARTAIAQAKAQSKKRVGHQGQTKYKSKKDPIQSFYCEYRKTRAEKGGVFISKIGIVKTSRQMPREVKLYNPRVTRKGNKWYLSFGIEKPEVKKELIDEVIGVDMGLTHLAITSEGKKYDNPNRSKKIRDLEKRKKEYQKSLSYR